MRTSINRGGRRQEPHPTVENPVIGPIEAFYCPRDTLLTLCNYVKIHD